MKSFWLAMQFMTRFPTPTLVDIQPENMGSAVHYFPTVGLLIGLLLVTVAQLSIWLPSDIVAMLVLAFWAWVTGGLHLDGVADTADGWLGGVGNQERTLEIMKDSQIGAAGAIALLIVLLMKWLVLSYMIDAQLWLVLLVTPLFARVASIGLMICTNYVRVNGVAEQMVSHLNRKLIFLWVSAAAIFLVLIHPGLLVGMAAVWLWLRWLMIRITGGMTGDTAGAMIEVMEIAFMLLMLKAFIW